MNMKLKRTLQVSGIIVGVLALLVFGFMIKMKSEINKMTPLETQELFDNITSIKDTYVNMYLIKDDDKYIAIDAGDKLDNIEDSFKKLKINPDKVTAVFLTHSDFDHVAAIELFENAAIYFSSQEEQMINGTTSRFVIVGNKIKTKAYQLLDDRQVINIGNTKIQGILIPGHTPGSMCYLINDKYLFTGDVLSLKDGKIERFNEMFIMDIETADKSLEKLIHFPDVEYIFTAHYGYSDDYKSAVGDWGK
ncbi:MAG: MBL fold metallo-hydrolase [candidate division Zixibacteria bacterium]|nr:MBL fold metallo-hydrolase [candidate division Zixibacteria bacterium]